RRRLAQTHVEREATAEPDRIEEAEPRERLGLVAAELADEPVGSEDGFRRDLVGRGEQIGRPALAADRDAARERPTFEPERESAGTRTSKPAASNCAPVTVINSHASSWLSTT